MQRVGGRGERLPTMRVVVLVMVVCAALGAGFLAGSRTSARRDAAAVGPLRESESAGPPGVAVDGNVEFTLVGWRCGMQVVVGDHAPWTPDGRYCRLRLRARNTERPTVEYRAAYQEVLAADGTVYPISTDAVQIADQPLTLRLSLGGVHEFDVWFDVPAGAEIVAARLRAREDSDGVEIRFSD